MLEIYPTTVEPAFIPLTAKTPLDGPVEAVILPRRVVPTEDTEWTPAEWVGPAATSRTVKVNVAGRQTEIPSAAATRASSKGQAKIFLRFPGVTQMIIRESGPVMVY